MVMNYLKNGFKCIVFVKGLLIVCLIFLNYLMSNVCK